MKGRPEGFQIGGAAKGAGRGEGCSFRFDAVFFGTNKQQPSDSRSSRCLVALGTGFPAEGGSSVARGAQGFKFPGNFLHEGI